MHVNIPKVCDHALVVHAHNGGLRRVCGYSVPPPYPATTHTLLSGSGANATHFTVTALCRGCTYWSVQGSDPESLNPNGENYLANAYSTVPVDYPRGGTNDVWNPSGYQPLSGLGITVHTFGSDGCLSGSKTLVSNPALNHGISLTADGTKLYVSSMTTAFEYSYNAASQTVSGERTVVRAMNQGGHPSRTLLIPPQTPHLLVISLGSFDNLDHPTINPATGRAIVKVFDLRNVPSGGYAFNTQGYLLGYGLRNGVALAADGGNHVYGASQFTDKAFRTGDQFVLTPNATFNDEDCARRGSVPPRLSFQAHSAPMDATFDRATENMFITFHGSWNRPVATGYKVVQVAFRRGANGRYEPVEPATSMTAAKDIFWSQNEGSCTSSTCFRPCGITFDRAYSRLIVGSDRPSEGELFMLIKT
ncbi:conserved hypothetical protein [Verticillium alfalfae VaMs.102]|uniref:Uncharacterized protein n=1 Tax=Verticillium alfalfae (strain VaMs.102 / ATCC MYA-4576 / FGSC 10136) TaxID=526221 RepID=C9SX08_VERA1|nr:conserved hypothetical protein [Verticillium alfalfae VaMs.102]EEY23549.1 conserved hypothetical protein [Verticillium alfalfae VaMs.102]